MYKTSFEYNEYMVEAKASDVDHYGAIDLRVKVYDDNNEQVQLEESELEDVRNEAETLLLEKKFDREVEF